MKEPTEMGLKTKKQANKNPRKKRRLHPYCGHCKKRFSTTSERKKFCQDSCRYAARAAQKLTQRKERLGHSPFMHYLASEAIKAGTVEILHGATVEGLLELYGVYVYTMRASKTGSSTTDTYEISHIAPRKGDNCIGLLHARNLVVAPKLMNRRHQNKHLGEGLSIDSAILRPEWRVEDDASNKDTINKIFSYLGNEIISNFQARAKLQPSKRHKILLWFEKQKDSPSPEKLEPMTTQALQKLKAEMEGKEVFRIPNYYHCTETVFLHELKRHSHYRPELSDMTSIWERVEPFYSYESEEFDNDIIPTNALAECHKLIFNTLHGMPSNHEELAELLGSHLPAPENSFAAAQ
ncbi:hypothetical protein [Pseudomonas sp. MBLB4136]|uniref:hypothetical protein n=1 Tax=Pseudomonas sp. MBLB4136 TaxID=3451558 RepID=UPI003F74D174